MSSYGSRACADDGSARIDGATLTFTWLYPRILDNGLAQAEAIRRAALSAAQGTQASGALAREALIGIKCALDPKSILNPGVVIP